VTPPRHVVFPQGRWLLLTWLAATLAAAIPAAVAIAAMPGAELAQFIGWAALVCSPIASAAALAVCRRSARTEPLTADSVIALYWLTGAGFAFAIPPIVGLVMLAGIVAGAPGPVTSGGVVGAVLMFFVGWLLATVVGVIGATPFALFAGYVARWTGFRSIGAQVAMAEDRVGVETLQ
jgi:hypothetical protein